MLDHVHFTGRLSHRYLCHLFPCSDVAEFPSVIPEAYPLVLMESLANGVLPAASNFSGFAEGLDALAEDLGAEMVSLLRLPTAPDRAVISMADQLATLLQRGGDDELRRTMRGIAVERYDWRVRAEQMALAYARCLDADRAEAPRCRRC